MIYFNLEEITNQCSLPLKLHIYQQNKMLPASRSGRGGEGGVAQWERRTWVSHIISLTARPLVGGKTPSEHSSKKQSARITPLREITHLLVLTILWICTLFLLLTSLFVARTPPRDHTGLLCSLGRYHTPPWLHVSGAGTASVWNFFSLHGTTCYVKSIF